MVFRFPDFSGAWSLVLGVSLGGGSKTEMPGRKRVAIGFLTLSLDLGKPEDSLVEMLLCFVQIRVDPANPGFTPVKVATGLGAQEPPAGLLEMFDHKRRIDMGSPNF